MKPRSFSSDVGAGGISDVFCRTYRFEPNPIANPNKGKMLALLRSIECTVGTDNWTRCIVSAK